jgi:hypothetical protein
MLVMARYAMSFVALKTGIFRRVLTLRGRQEVLLSMHYHALPYVDHLADRSNC